MIASIQSRLDGETTMTEFISKTSGEQLYVTIDNRFLLVIRRAAPSGAAGTGNLCIEVVPITQGEPWDQPCETFLVDEGEIVELERELTE